LIPALAASAPGNVRFAIEGVGGGSFAEARLAPNPGAPEETPEPLCLTLAGGAPGNSQALVQWMESNEAGRPLAERPDATLTVMRDQDGLKKGVYHLSDITIRQVRLAPDRNVGSTRIEGVEVNCDGVEDGLNRSGSS
jgi:hypothetical protein